MDTSNWLLADRDMYRQLAAERLAEIERLTRKLEQAPDAVLAAINAAPDTVRRLAEERGAEIERLKAELADLHARWPKVNEARDHVAECNELLNAKDAEINRLKAKLASCTPAWTVTASARSDTLDAISARLDAAMASGSQQIVMLKTQLDDACRVAAENREKVQSRLSALEKAVLPVLPEDDSAAEPVEAGVVQAMRANDFSRVVFWAGGVVDVYTRVGASQRGSSLADCISKLLARQAEETSDG